MSSLLKFNVYIINSLRLQLFINLAILPIFWYWGLPISLINPIGNIIFAPFLVIFLILSSTIFFTEVLSLPNELLIYLLEQFTTLWMWITVKLNFNTLLTFPKPAWPFAGVILTLALICLMHRKLQKGTASLKALIFVWFIFIFNNSLLQPKEGIYIIEKTGRNSSYPLFIGNSKEAVLILKPINKPNQYNQLQKIKDFLLNMGIKKVNKIILKEVSTNSLQLLLALTKIVKLEEIYIPTLSKFLNKAKFNIWLQLLEICSSYKIKVNEVSSVIYVSQDRSFSNNLITLRLNPIINAKKSYLSISGSFGCRLFTA